MSRYITKLSSDCLEPLDGNNYRCKKHGFVLKNPKFPVMCRMCDTNSNDDSKSLKNTGCSKGNDSTNTDNENIIHPGDALNGSVTPIGPNILQLGVNFAGAMTRYIGSGFKHVSEEEYRLRIEQCNKNECGFYNGSRCLHVSCGCFLSKKAWLATENCPVGLWHILRDGV